MRSPAPVRAVAKTVAIDGATAPIDNRNLLVFRRLLTIGIRSYFPGFLHGRSGFVANSRFAEAVLRRDPQRG